MFIQSLINFLYRHPKSKYKNIQRFGGYFNYKNMIAAKEVMQIQSENLLPIKSHEKGLTIYFLTGKAYLYQTLFCIKSLISVTNKKFQFILIDDGSFDSDLIVRIERQLPNAKIITKLEIEQNLHKVLPLDKFPILHQKRKEYAHIKKLTDIHSIPGKWKLVLDSDMLFWKEPKKLIEWLEKPADPLHMIDCEESYGYSNRIMETLAGNKIPKLVNVGAIGLNSETINWDKLENWIYHLEKEEGKTYYLEQALSAMLLSNENASALNEDYKVNPTKEEILNETGILHHYVDLSKEWYFKDAWKKLIAEL